jgi:hypothetical protein
MSFPGMPKHMCVVAGEKLKTLEYNRSKIRRKRDLEEIEDQIDNS